MTSRLRLPNNFHKIDRRERLALLNILKPAYEHFLKRCDVVAHEFTTPRAAESLAKIKKELLYSLAKCQEEIAFASSGAGRSPAVKAHGCAALASCAGSTSRFLKVAGNARKETA